MFQHVLDNLARARRRFGHALHPNVEVSAVPEGILADWNVPVTTRDGTVLRVNVFRPATGGPVPVIMSAHPYGKDRLPANTRSGRGVNFQYRLFPQPRPVRFSAWTSWEAPDPAVWVPRGYAVVNADLRGGGTSDGVGELLSDQEAEDYYDLIEWAGTQPWSSGRVALDGVSYLAISQYKVAALAPPHLAAICPWEGFSDLYRDFARPGGVRETGFSVIWSKMTGKFARVRTPLLPELDGRAEFDAWYAARTPAIEPIRVPMLVCGSFSDQSLHTRGSFELYRRAASERKWLYTHRNGKWCTYYGPEATEARGRFYDHVLKGQDNGWDREPPVRLAIHDHGPDPDAVTGEEAWPPRDLAWTELWLDAADGSLRPERPGQEGRTAFDTRRGTAVFTWRVPEDCDVIGPMALRVPIALEGADDVFLFAGVRKFRDGAEQRFEGSYGFDADMVTKGWQRAAHRTLDAHLSTPEQPVHRHDRTEPLAPGEIVTVEIALLPQATRLLRGDELRLELRGHWHFRRDPVRGQFPAGYCTSPAGRCLVHTGGAHEARLLIGRRSPR